MKHLSSMSDKSSILSSSATASEIQVHPGYGTNWRSSRVPSTNNSTASHWLVCFWVCLHPYRWGNWFLCINGWHSHTGIDSRSILLVQNNCSLLWCHRNPLDGQNMTWVFHLRAQKTHFSRLVKRTTWARDLFKERIWYEEIIQVKSDDIGQFHLWTQIQKSQMKYYQIKCCSVSK